MGPERQVLRYSLFTRATLIVGVLLFAVFSGHVLNELRSPIVYLILASTSMLCLHLFVLSLYSITITETGLEVWRFFQREKLAWHEIDHARPGNWDSFQLLNEREDKKLHINSQVIGYFDLVALIVSKRPNVWPSHEQRTFYNSPWGALFFLLATAMWSYLMLLAVLGQASPDWLSASAFLLADLMTLLVLLRLPRLVRFDGDKLIIQRWLGQEQIPVETIQKVIIPRKSAFGTTIHAVTLLTMEGKKYQIDSLRDGLPPFVIALDTWIDRYHPLAEADK